ncbi:MAG: hypothetical protein Q9160_005890 [Pyrenula sp. 1 TL-2023]
MSTSFNSGSRQKRLGLLDLPTEIRLIIYKNVLACRDPSGVIDFTIIKALKDHTAVLCTNKLINREATPIFYAINIFHFCPPMSAPRPTLFPAALINSKGVAQGRFFERIDLNLTNDLDCYKGLTAETWKNIQSDVEEFGLNKLRQLRLCIDRPLRTIHTCRGKERCRRPISDPTRRSAHDRFKLNVLLLEAYNFLVANMGWDRVAYKSEPYRTCQSNVGHIPRHLVKLVKKGGTIEPEYTEIFRVISQNSFWLNIVNMERYRTGHSAVDPDMSSFLVPPSGYLELEPLLGEPPFPILKEAKV